MNYCTWFDKIKNAAEQIVSEGRRMSFDELAATIGQKPQLMGRRVGSAWKYYAEQKDCGACSVIAVAFYPKKNPNGTCIASPW